jgi:hypothetical protein
VGLLIPARLTKCRILRPVRSTICAAMNFAASASCPVHGNRFVSSGSSKSVSMFPRNTRIRPTVSWDSRGSERMALRPLLFRHRLMPKAGRLPGDVPGRPFAHEGGHGLLHAHLFALDDIPLHFFDKDSHSGDQILCRDVQGDEKKAHRYDGRWWKVQANRTMSSLLCPRPLVVEAMKPFLAPAGQLGVELLAENRREKSARALAETGSEAIRIGGIVSRSLPQKCDHSGPLSKSTSACLRSLLRRCRLLGPLSQRQSCRV